MNGHHLKLLKELSENNSQSQRELSQKLGLMTYMYILTPAGIKSKMQLSRNFLKRKLDEYEMLKMEIEALKREEVTIYERKHINHKIF